MPYFPNLREGDQMREMIDAFGGYNHNMRIQEGEWYDMKNLSSSHFPLFARRKPRSLYKGDMINPQGMLAKDALAWVDGSTLYYNGLPIDGITLSTDPEDCPKQLVSMGAYLCIFPDGVYLNTANLADKGLMSAVYESVENANITYTPCKSDGSSFGENEITVSDTEPADPENGMYWLDTSSTIHVLKQYSANTKAWAEVPTVYTRIEVSGIGMQFSTYDGVTISGATCDDEDMKAQIEALNKDMLLYGRGNDYIIVTALISKLVVQSSGSIRVERKIPKMSYVCEANNRLWGCYYGMHNGVAVNEIYSCKLGDFRNWNSFMGISTDSYVVSVGTDGEFTGCTSYLGYPVFFKENCIHRIYGTQPSAYQVHTTTCRGVQRGSDKSIRVVNEVLYYKSRSDVCAYDGSLPVGVSAQLGDEVYYDACAGTFGGKYYISMRDSAHKWTMFVYDTARRLWHKEDNTHASAFTAWNDALYMLDEDKKAIWDLNGTAGTAEASIPWMAESGLIGYVQPDHKYASRFNFRMKMSKGATCRLEIEYDSSGEWEDQGTIEGQGTNSFILPVIPRRCDHFRIRLTGTGEVFIYSIAKFLEWGSDA